MCTRWLGVGEMDEKVRVGGLQMRQLKVHQRQPDTSSSIFFVQFLPLDEAATSRVVFVIISGSDGRAGANAFGAN